MRKIYRTVGGNVQYLACHSSLAQMLQYLTFWNRIPLERVKFYRKSPESHTIYNNVNSQTNVLFLLGAPYNKSLILS